MRITGVDGDVILVGGEFHHPPLPPQRARAASFVGHYRYKLKRHGGRLKIAERRAILDAQQLGLLGSVSFIL